MTREGGCPHCGAGEICVGHDGRCVVCLRRSSTISGWVWATVVIAALVGLLRGF